MIEEKIKNKIAIGLAAIALSVGGMACGNDQCPSSASSQSNYLSQRGFFLSADYNALSSSYECPPDCSFYGETEDQYCCWCPD